MLSNYIYYISILHIYMYMRTCEEMYYSSHVPVSTG